MINQNQRLPAGSLKISQEVIATIAGVAALEIEGVARLAQHSPGLRHKSLAASRKKNADVIISDDFAEIDIGLVLSFGARIGEVCTAVQTAVKENVQTMTGMAVSKVNVYVDNIVFFEERAHDAG